MPSECLPTEFCLMLNEPEAEIVGSVPVLKPAWFCNYLEFSFSGFVQNSVPVALDLQNKMFMSMIPPTQSGEWICSICVARLWEAHTEKEKSDQQRESIPFMYFSVRNEDNPLLPFLPPLHPLQKKKKRGIIWYLKYFSFLKVYFGLLGQCLVICGSRVNIKRKEHFTEELKYRLL